MQTPRRIALCLEALLLGLILATPTAGQEDRKRMAESLELLRSRDRVEMHPEPFHVVGLEQGGNDMRSRTPALVNASPVDIALDRDELYERTLALYADGAVFHRSPSSAAREPSSEEDSAPVRASESASAPAEAPRVRRFGALRWGLPLAFAALLALAGRRRLRILLRSSKRPAA